MYDRYTGKSFEHRRQWMIERIRYLTDVFSIMALPLRTCYSCSNFPPTNYWTGRVIREDKRGAVSGNVSALLTILGLDTDTWFILANDFGKDYHGAIGSLEELALFAEHTGKQWISGKNKLRRIYN